MKPIQLTLFLLLSALTMNAQKELSSSNSTNSSRVTQTNNGKKAFILGNYSYSNVVRLKNPENDTDDMKTVLDELKFNTKHTYKNLSKAAFETNFKNFILGLNQSDTVIFYFSGHGAAIERKNYLIPVDARFNCAGDLEKNSIKLDAILSVLAAKNIKNGFIIIDACRNLPLKPCSNQVPFSGGHSRPKDNLDNNFTIFATSEGQTADDNWFNQRNSAFTASLLKYLREPNLSIRDITDKTVKDVLDVSARRQKPERYDDLTLDLVYRGKKSVSSEKFSSPSYIVKETKEFKRTEFNVNCPTCGTHSQYLIEFEDGIWGYIFKGIRNRYFVNISGVFYDYVDDIDIGTGKLYKYKLYRRE